jgi:co-chaperonin GroES (HSP10)
MTAEFNPEQFTPLHGFVLVREIENNITRGGVALPDTAAREYGLAEVVSCGPGKECEAGTRMEMPVKPGDTIFMYFPQFAPPVDMPMLGSNYKLVQAQWICGKVNL